LRRRSTDRAITVTFVFIIRSCIGFVRTERSAVIVSRTFGIGFICSDTTACDGACIYR
jgi:hypothetical protein